MMMMTGPAMSAAQRLAETGAGDGEPGGKPGSSGGKPGTGEPGGRPGKTVGTSRGSLDGAPVTIGDVKGQHPAGTWPGSRRSLLAVPVLSCQPRRRRNATGGWPVFGKVRTSICWAACCRKTRQTSRFSLEKRRSLTRRTRFTRTFGILVRARPARSLSSSTGFDPSLGISGGGTHLIGQAFTALARVTGHSHVVVKCPKLGRQNMPTRTSA